MNFPAAQAAIASVMIHGAITHPANDWRNYPATFHIARAVRYLELLAAGDQSEPHLHHALCRLLMATELTSNA
jgi:hypothetical protein